MLQGFHAGLDFKVALNFKTLQRCLNCFWKWEDGILMFWI